MTCKLSVHFLMIVALAWMGGFADARSNEGEFLPDETPIAQVSFHFFTGAEFRQRFVREIGPSREALFPDKRAVTLEGVAGLLMRL